MSLDNCGFLIAKEFLNNVLFMSSLENLPSYLIFSWKISFEILGRVSLKIHTWKTVSQVTLTSGVRISEIHALSWIFMRDRHWGYVILRPVPKFMFKNQLAVEGASYGIFIVPLRGAFLWEGSLYGQVF